MSLPSVCHSYVLVYHPYVTLMYSDSYVIRVSLSYARISSVRHSYVLVCHTHVTRIYSYVIRMSIVWKWHIFCIWKWHIPLFWKCRIFAVETDTFSYLKKVHFRIWNWHVFHNWKRRILCFQTDVSFLIIRRLDY